MVDLNFKENLRKLRKAAKLTQAELADKIKVDQRTISAWETGVAEPDMQTLSLLCDFFDCDFNTLLNKNNPSE